MSEPFKFGGKDVAIQPLSISQLKVLKQEMAKAKQFGPFAEDDVHDAVVKVVKASIGESAQLSEEEIADSVNLGNFGDIWSALLGLPVKRVAPGEAPAGQAAA